MARYLDLSNANKGPEVSSIGAFTHLIWPESAFPFILTERRDQLAAIAKTVAAFDYAYYRGYAIGKGRGRVWWAAKNF